MINPDINLVDSVLEVKASGVENSIENDFNLPEGKSIAELLNDQKTKEKEKKQ
jgi:hypothetical protein